MCSSCLILEYGRTGSFVFPKCHCSFLFGVLRLKIVLHYLML
uniref:Uncharacterized protein n=1 Tax=Arundo donax TaxID=35708 RepID=A0A0A9AB21_ARUDO